jgi:hypothetical protein
MESDDFETAKADGRPGADTDLAASPNGADRPRRLRRFAEPDRKSVLAELGFAGLQVWQPLSEAAGRGHGPQEMAVMFTDLAGLSSWALKAGDEQALALLREVGTRVETTEEIEVDGYRPSMRVGVHWGWPRDLHVVRVGRD